MSGNVLSKDEVDQLLDGVDQDQLAVGENGGDEIRDFSFRSPGLMASDQMRDINDLHEDFANSFQSQLAISFRKNVEVSCVSVEHHSYDEFILSLSSISYLTMLSAKPMAGKIVSEINLSLLFGLVDLFLGGEGDAETSVRTPTELEISIFEPVMAIFYKSLSEALALVAPVEIVEENVQTDPPELKAAPGVAPVTVFAFDVKIGLAGGIINICYPLPMVQHMLAELKEGEGRMDNYYGKTAPSDYSHQILASLMKVPMNSSVDLGDAWLKARDWINLKVGDVILLNQVIGSPVTLQVEEKPFFKGFIGKSNKNLSVKLQQRIEGKQDVDANVYIPGVSGAT